MRYVVYGAFHRDNLRVRKKLRTMSAHRLHEIALRAIDKQDRTRQTPYESLDLSLGHRRCCSITQDRIVFPAIASASVAGPVPRHVESGIVGNQRKSFLQPLCSGFQRFMREGDFHIVSSLEALGDDVRHFFVAAGEWPKGFEKD